MIEKEYTLKETANTIRKRLKTRWPGTKFSVRTEYYCTGNTSIRIKWRMGPLLDTVYAAMREFVSLGPSGCDDYAPPITTDYVGDDGSIERVRWRCDYLHLDREPKLYVLPIVHTCRPRVYGVSGIEIPF